MQQCQKQQRHINKEEHDTVAQCLLLRSQTVSK